MLKYKLWDIDGTQDIYSVSGITLSLNVKGNMDYYSHNSTLSYGNNKRKAEVIFLLSLDLFTLPY